VRLWGDDLTLMLFCAVNRYLMESVAYFLGHINLSMALLDMPPKPSPCARSLQHHKKRPWCCWAPAATEAAEEAATAAADAAGGSRRVGVQLLWLFMHLRLLPTQVWEFGVWGSAMV
jgi:hypothetical protein